MFQNKPKAGRVVILSGGMDSLVVLAYAISTYGKQNVRAISFNYGQKHVRELGQATEIAAYYDIPHEIIYVPQLWAAAKSYLTNPSINAEQFMAQDYASLQERQGAQPSVVPGRNLMFLALAASYAEIHDCGYIMLGNHAGDAHNWHYPDCTPAFTRAATLAIELGTDGAVTLDAPFSPVTKAEIVAAGAVLSVPFELSQSCYQGHRPACGVCATCLERYNAFCEAGYRDPLPYAIELDWGDRKTPTEVFVK